MIHATTRPFLENFFDEVISAFEAWLSKLRFAHCQLPVDVIVNMSLAHIAAGTMGPVHLNSISNPCTMGDIIGSVLDLLPPQVWSIMPPSEMVGIPKLFKVCCLVIVCLEICLTLQCRSLRSSVPKAPIPRLEL